MNAFDHAVLCEVQFGMAEVEEILYAIGNQCQVGAALFGIGVRVPIHGLLGTGAVGVVVFHEQNRCIALGSQDIHPLNQPVVD